MESYKIPLEKKLRVSINPRLIDKNAANDNSLWTDGWENVELTPSELAAVVRKGIAYCCQLNGRRKTANFFASDIVSVDVDGTKKIEEALEHPLVRDYAGLVYTTVSHTPEQHRFRIVFATPRTITDPNEMGAVARSLALRLAGDPSAVDPARISFGSTRCQVWLFDRQLSPELLQELIDQSRWTSATGTSKNTFRSPMQFPPDQLITLADGSAAKLADVTGKVAIYCPFHADGNPSAFVVRSKRGVNGLHCSTCATTFWPEGSDAYDFDNFERTVKQAFEQRLDTDCRISVVSGTPAPPELLPGVTFIRSPKGSGKTAALRPLLRDCRSVLLISHRRALISNTCERLDLASYLDTNPTRRYGICLDSLWRISAGTQYDAVVIDESEQVLAHFLSDTLAEKKSEGFRLRLFVIFSRLVASARCVVALDADLGEVTYATLAAMRSSSDRSRDLHLWLNTEQLHVVREIEVYDSKQHLVADLKRALAEGKRCFVTSNSKMLVEKLSAALHDTTVSSKQILVTSDTITTDPVKEFIASPRTEALNYDVILTSPSLGTGVDITFPGREELIDVVFGFFETGINTHFDCDQQLARVRNPKATRVWINPRRFDYETDAQAVKQDLLTASAYVNLLDGYGSNGEPIYREDPFIDMAALILSQQLASKNALKANFVAHKKRQGFVAKRVEADDEMRAEGKSLLTLGKTLAVEEYVAKLLAACVLRSPTYEEMTERIESGADVRESDWWSYERTRLELFYRRRADRHLILLDQHGKYRAQVRLFEDAVMDRKRTRLSRVMIEMTDDARPIRSRADTAFVIMNLLERTPLLPPSTDNNPVIPSSDVCGLVEDAIVDSSQLTSFVDYAVENRSIIQSVLRTEVRSDVAGKPVQMLNEVLKLVGLRVVEADRHKKGGRRIYRYRPDPERLDRMKRVVDFRKQGAWTWLYREYQYQWGVNNEEESAEGDQSSTHPDEANAGEVPLDQFADPATLDCDEISQDSPAS